MFRKWIIFGLCLAVSSAFAQQGDKMDLGRLQTGAIVSFNRTADGQWGIEITGAPAPRILQPKPAKLEIFSSETDILLTKGK